MKKASVAIDLGTTNTVAARWNDETDTPEIIHIETICRNVSTHSEVDDSYTIPSTLYLLTPEESLPFPFKYLFKNLRSKTRALIGTRAIQKDGGIYSPRFVNNFKSYLGKNSFQFIGRIGKWRYTAEDISRIFLKALIAEIKKVKGIKPDRVTICVPVDFYEFYRAKLQRILSRMKIRKIKTIDEPVAAALGYGLNIDETRYVLIIDFGGGTLDLALIKTEEGTGSKGQCTVVAKDGAPVGGNLVDAWIVEEVSAQYSYNFDRLSQDADIRWWYRMLLGEACRVKESLFFKEQETFYLMPSNLMKKYAPSIPGSHPDMKKPANFSRKDLVALLEKKGLYTMLPELIDSVTASATAKGIKENMIDDVLMVGGSTLLPEIYSIIEKKFGRDRVRAWQPFNAVAFGAAAFAANRISKSDHITHDYAFVTYNRKTLEPEYNIVVPRGTPYPTPKDFWKKHLSPTCALGEPERIFKLVICEIGRKHAFDQEFIWDEKGDLHLLDENSKGKDVIVPLNESDPTLGYLNPPHYPSDRHARIEISFMVNEDKWLCSTVFDLKTGKYLLNEKPVIRMK